MFDPANFVHGGHDVNEAFELLRGRIEYFHIKDCVAATKKIVPAGFGDGNIKNILNAYEKDFGARETFLSVEPHLKVFGGYAALEKGERSVKEDDFTYESNEAAFNAACGALWYLLQ